MTDHILAVYVKSDGSRRVLIVRRNDGLYSYRLQLSVKHGDVVEWDQAGPYCGIYDAAETAEVEAASRVNWLRAS